MVINIYACEWIKTNTDFRVIDSMQKYQKFHWNVNLRWEVTFQSIGGNEVNYRGG